MPFWTDFLDMQHLWDKMKYYFRSSTENADTVVCVKLEILFSIKSISFFNMKKNLTLRPTAASRTNKCCLFINAGIITVQNNPAAYIKSNKRTANKRTVYTTVLLRTRWKALKLYPWFRTIYKLTSRREHEDIQRKNTYRLHRKSRWVTGVASLSLAIGRLSL